MDENMSEQTVTYHNIRASNILLYVKITGNISHILAALSVGNSANQTRSIELMLY